MNIKYLNIKKLPKIKLTLKKKIIKIRTNDLTELINIKNLFNPHY